MAWWDYKELPRLGLLYGLLFYFFYSFARFHIEFIPIVQWDLYSLSVHSLSAPSFNEILKLLNSSAFAGDTANKFIKLQGIFFLTLRFASFGYNVSVWKKSIGKYWIQYYFCEFPILYREKSIRFNTDQYFFSYDYFAIY